MYIKIANKMAFSFILRVLMNEYIREVFTQCAEYFPDTGSLRLLCQLYILNCLSIIL